MIDTLNQAECVLRRMFHFGEPETLDAFSTSTGDAVDFIHPQAQHSLFGPSGRKELLADRASFLAFVERCAAALADRRDEILAITGIDEQCAFVHARAWRKAAATGEEIEYEWSMLYRVEDGQITYATDMLDRDAQAFWGRVLG